MKSRKFLLGIITIFSLTMFISCSDKNTVQDNNKNSLISESSSKKTTINDIFNSKEVSNNTIGYSLLNRWLPDNREGKFLYDNSNIYYISDDNLSLIRTDLDGNNRNTVFNFNKFYSPTSLNNYGDYIYMLYTNNKSYSINRLNKKTFAFDEVVSNIANYENCDLIIVNDTLIYNDLIRANDQIIEASLNSLNLLTNEYKVLAKKTDGKGYDFDVTENKLYAIDGTCVNFSDMSVSNTNADEFNKITYSKNGYEFQLSGRDDTTLYISKQNASDEYDLTIKVNDADVLSEFKENTVLTSLWKTVIPLDNDIIISYRQEVDSKNDLVKLYNINESGDLTKITEYITPIHGSLWVVGNNLAHIDTNDKITVIKSN